MPSAISRRASSLFSRARLSGTSGYWPRDSSFSMPCRRYLKRQSRAPDVETLRYSPCVSKSFYALSLGLAALTRESVSTPIAR
jgi:hypothetical protein